MEEPKKLKGRRLPPNQRPYNAFAPADTRSQRTSRQIRLPRWIGLHADLLVLGALLDDPVIGADDKIHIADLGEVERANGLFVERRLLAAGNHDDLGREVLEAHRNLEVVAKLAPLLTGRHHADIPAVIKYAACKPEMRVHKGRARAYNSEEEAYQAVVKREINPGDVIIVRYEGPRGSGMQELLMLTDAIVADPALNATTALITDGRFSGATGGPLAYVHTGDIIAYDIPNRTLNLLGIDGVECGAEEAAKVLEQRAKEEEIVPRPPRKGLYRRYATHALSAMEGAGY